MGIYVGIRQTSSSDSFIEYEFGPDENSVGQLRICRKTGAIEILKEVPNDANRSYSVRAARKLTLHFRNNEFPDVTCFAS